MQTVRDFLEQITTVSIFESVASKKQLEERLPRKNRNSRENTHLEYYSEAFVLQFASGLGNELLPDCREKVVDLIDCFSRSGVVPFLRIS